MARRVSFSLDGTWKRVRVSANYENKTGGGSIYDYNNIIYTVMYPIIKTNFNVIYLVRRKRKE